MQGYVNWLLLCNLEEFIGYKNDKIIVSQCFQYLATSAPCLRLLLRQRLEARRNVSSELMRSYFRRFCHHSSENRNYSSLSLGLCICLAFCYHTLHWSVWTMAGAYIEEWLYEWDRCVAIVSPSPPLLPATWWLDPGSLFFLLLLPRDPPCRSLAWASRSAMGRARRERKLRLACSSLL